MDEDVTVGAFRLLNAACAVDGLGLPSPPMLLVLANQNFADLLADVAARI